MIRWHHRTFLIWNCSKVRTVTKIQIAQIASDRAKYFAQIVSHWFEAASFALVWCHTSGNFSSKSNTDTYRILTSRLYSNVNATESMCLRVCACVQYWQEHSCAYRYIYWNWHAQLQLHISVFLLFSHAPSLIHLSLSASRSCMCLYVHARIKRAHKTVFNHIMHFLCYQYMYV